MAELKITLDIMLPVFIMLALGWLLRRTGLLCGDVPGKLNKLIFQLFLPVMLFENARSMESLATDDLSMTIFIFFGLLIIWLCAMLLVPRFEKDPRKRGVLVQGCFRSNFAILGVPLLDAMFGQRGLIAVSLAMPVVILMNNTLAVVSLSVHAGKKMDLGRILRNVITNPLIIGCALGMICFGLGVTFQPPVEKVLSQLSQVTTPLSLLVLGASLNWQGVRHNRTQLLWTVLVKQAIVPAVMITLAILLGFSFEELGVLIVLFGAPCAVSSYPMAAAMGGDGELAAGQVVLTTLFSMVTLFVLIYVGKLLAVL